MRLKINKPALYLTRIFIFVLTLACAFAYRVNADDNGDVYTEQDIELSGNLNADSYRFAANQMLPAGEPQFDIAIAVDTKAEEPLLSIYLTGDEIKKIAELEASYSYKLNFGTLFTSGLSYELNDKRPKLDKVSDIYLSPSMLEKSRTELESDKTYRIVTTDSCIAIIKKLSGFSLGLVKIPEEKLNNAAEITDESGKAAGNWAAWRAYKNSFPDEGNGISYESLRGRRIVKSTYAPSEYFKNTSRYFYIIIITGALIIITIVIITRVIILRKHKKKVFVE